MASNGFSMFQSDQFGTTPWSDPFASSFTDQAATMTAAGSSVPLGGFGDSAIGSQAGGLFDMEGGAGWGMAAGAIGGMGDTLWGESGTGGQFTQMGAAAGPWGMLVGAIVDTGLSASMQIAAERDAEVRANEFWEEAQDYLEGIDKKIGTQEAAIKVAQSGTGATLSSGTFEFYRSENEKRNLTQYTDTFSKLREQYDEILDVGDGGIMGKVHKALGKISPGVPQMDKYMSRYF